MLTTFLDSGALLIELSDALAASSGDAAELAHRVARVRVELLDHLPGANTPLVQYAEAAARALLRRGLDDALPAVAHDVPPARARLERMRMVIGFLRALQRVPDAVRLGPTVAELLRPEMPSRTKLLHELASEVDVAENLPAALIDLCTREAVDARATLRRIGRELVAEAQTRGNDACALEAWLHAEGVAPTRVGGRTLRVLAVRLVASEGRGWTVCWLRGISPGLKILRLRPTRPVVTDTDGLWDVVRPAAAELVAAGFVTTTDQLVLSLEVESSRVLDGFHHATDRRRKQFWLHFAAVTLWPWLDCPGDVSGLRYDGPLHRPTAEAPSQTVALRCHAIDLEGMRAHAAQRVLLVCAEPAWRRQADGLSAAVDTHENRTASVLVAGDECEAFVDRLFAADRTRPFHDLFHAVRAWLGQGKDVHILWTDPDYQANPHPLEMLPP